MNGRERLTDILSYKSDHCGFWHGNPNWKCRDRIFSELGVKNDFEIPSFEMLYWSFTLLYATAK